MQISPLKHIAARRPCVDRHTRPARSAACCHPWKGSAGWWRAGNELCRKAWWERLWYHHIQNYRMAPPSGDRQGKQDHGARWGTYEISGKLATHLTSAYATFPDTYCWTACHVFLSARPHWDCCSSSTFFCCSDPDVGLADALNLMTNMSLNHWATEQTASTPSQSYRSPGVAPNILLRHRSWLPRLCDRNVCNPGPSTKRRPLQQNCNFWWMKNHAFQWTSPTRICALSMKTGDQLRPTLTNSKHATQVSHPFTNESSWNAMEGLR